MLIYILNSVVLAELYAVTVFSFGNFGLPPKSSIIIPFPSSLSKPLCFVLAFVDVAA